MKKIHALLLVTVLTCAALFVHASSSPIPPWFSSFMDGVKVKNANSNETGIFVRRVARFVYDTTVQGGTVATHGLGTVLPARAVITRSYFKIITQFVDSGTGTVALQCEDANNIKTATDITGSSANAFVEGASTGAASAFVRDIAADCEISAVVGGVTTAGKLVGWVEYVIEN